MEMKRIGAGEFKQTCLALLDEVSSGHVEILVTKRGRPVARVVAVESDEEREKAILDEMRGTGHMLVEESVFLQPTGEAAGWSDEALE